MRILLLFLCNFIGVIPYGKGCWIVVQISTNYVFGKEPYNVPCKEEQKGIPMGVYGMTKLHGEQRIIATGRKHVIIRTV